MASVLRTESGFDPNDLHVNGRNGGDIHPATKADAIVQAIDLIVVQRKSVDLGLGQVNSGNLPSLGLSVADALDPCKNLAAAAKILSASYITASRTQTDTQQALRTALSRYNTGDPARGFANGYVGKVERSAEYVVPAISVATTAAPEVAPNSPAAPVQPVQSQALPASWDAFGMAALHSTSAFAPASNSVPTATAAPATPSVFPLSVAPAAPAAAGQAAAAEPVVLHAAD
jgi:type IV secretion system protein VirB1